MKERIEELKIELNNVNKKISELDNQLKNIKDKKYKTYTRLQELENQAIVEDFRQALRDLIIDKGGSHNCYNTKGHGIITLDDESTIFKITPEIDVEDIRDIMKQYNIFKITLESSTKCDWGSYYPFTITIIKPGLNHSVCFHNLMD